MKTLKNSIVVLFMSAFMSLGCMAQNAIQGNIENWSNGEVPLIFNDYISKAKINMGSISSNGEMIIPLDDDYLSNLKDAALKAKETAPEGWKMKFNTVESVFGCGDEGIIYENASIIFTGLPDLEALNDDESTSYGYIYCTNNTELSTWLFNYGQGNIAKGYYLRWFYAEDNASVKGTCDMPTYTGNADENYVDTTVYNLEIKKGWNIIKYAITETFISQEGKISPSKTEITTIDEVPIDALWLLL
ncbi:hypothetical protein [Formosa sp. PL04]|uniref:hypothetical protein n=1 Tax=Formosa sp. PL04 TaxID=3081755 RepID=UPI0029817ABA|nr:hypothetical protein [Formosa sp. PL04]MDW5290224.1 hypothetical protein [Formosa sp. PL04]